MSFRCIGCNAAIEARYKNCPECGEPVTDFLREYIEKPVGGNYQLLGKLGRGGMGEVYRARHIYFHNDVVIKVMRPQLAGDTSLTERFIREARVARKIKHDNVAQIYDFSSLPDGSFYMVWEFIDGKDLGQIIRERGALPPEYMAQISVQALRGLEAIHRAGFVHRDISPDNVMVTKDDEGRDLVKIIDLGIAKQDTESGETLTGTGLFVGKLKYASPEHLGFLSEGERIDARADLYSFGIVMYEMLAGKAPFVASTPRQYISMQMKEPPPPLPSTSQVTAALQPLIVKALEKDRSNRFSSARDFADQIEKVMISGAGSADGMVHTEKDEPTWIHPLSSAASEQVSPERSSLIANGTKAPAIVTDPEPVASVERTTAPAVAAILSKPEPSLALPTATTVRGREGVVNRDRGVRPARYRKVLLAIVGSIVLMCALFAVLLRFRTAKQDEEGAGNTAARPTAPMTVAQTPSTTTTAATTTTGVQQTLEQILEEPTTGDTYQFDPQGRRDPFRSLIGPAPKLQPRPSGVPGFLIDEMNLLGVLKSKPRLVGMVSGPDNKGYLLHVGDKVLDGEVIRITPTSVVFRQEVNDPTRIERYREVVKDLTPPGERKP